MKRSPLSPGSKPLQRSSELKRTPLKASTKRERRSASFTPASQVQRDKVREMGYCIACGAFLSEYVAIDPAHLCPRSKGGCSGRDCVVPLCRTLDGGCHRLFDDGRLDLLPVLEPGFRQEVAHCVGHMGILSALHRLSGERYVPVSEAAA